MEILINNSNNIATGFVLRENFNLRDYISVKYQGKEIDFLGVRDGYDRVFLSVSSEYSGKSLNITLKTPNSFFKEDEETEIGYLTRLSYSFQQTLRKAPQPILKPGQLRFAFLNSSDFSASREQLMDNPYIIKGMFYFLSVAADYKKQAINITNNKNLMMIFHRTNENPLTDLVFSPAIDGMNSMMIVTGKNDMMNKSVILTALYFNLNGATLKVKNNV